jgi:hypothetical protein
MTVHRAMELSRFPLLKLFLCALITDRTTVVSGRVDFRMWQ